MVKTESRQKLENIVVNITLLLLFFLPQSSLQYVAIIGVMVLCVWSNFKRLHLDWLKIAIVIAIAISFLINSATNAEGQGIAPKTMVRCTMILLMLVFFPFVKSHKIYPATIYFAILYLLFSQLCYFFHLTPFWKYYDIIYPYNGDIYIWSSEYLSKQYMNLMVRFGGLYHNPNQCARAYTFLLAIMYVEWGNLENGIFKKFVLAASLLGVLLTGSRTGLLAYLLMLLFFYYKNINSENKVRNVIIFTIVGIVLMFLYNNIQIRSVDLSGGMDHSFGTKIGFLYDYLTNEQSGLYTLFGHFNLELDAVAHYIPFGTMDAEWGFAIFGYGFVFFALVILYYLRLMKSFMGTKYVMLNFWIIWSISGTVLFSFSASMCWFFVLSLYTSRMNDEKDLEENKITISN